MYERVLKKKNTPNSNAGNQIAMVISDIVKLIFWVHILMVFAFYMIN